MSARNWAISHRRRGVTLLLTLLLLTVLSLLLARRVMEAATVRLAASAESFSLESQWAAEGAARQWLSRSQDHSVPWSQLLAESHWRLGEMEMQIRPSTAESKLCLRTIKADRWVALWRHSGGELRLAENPQIALADSNYTAMECVLDPHYPSAAAAYIAPGGNVAPGDLFSVWGEGKIDLNRASPAVMSAALTGFTDAQIGAIARMRKNAPIRSLVPLGDQLGLSASQQRTLQENACLESRFMEMLIQVHRGPLRALYFAVLDRQAPGKLLELRAIP